MANRETEKEYSGTGANQLVPNPTRLICQLVPIPTRSPIYNIAVCVVLGAI